MSNIITGYEAIDYAEQQGLTLSKYNDPIEDARDGLTVDEARQVAAEDPSLVWVSVETWTCRDVSLGADPAEVTHYAPTAEAAAEKFVRDGDYHSDPEDGTFPVVVGVLAEGDDPDDEERHTVFVEPAAPRCDSDEGHAWEQDSVRGSGGGVLIVERCTRCGCGKHTDTWAPRPDNGQPFERKWYVEGEFEVDEVDEDDEDDGE